MRSWSGIVPNLIFSSVLTVAAIGCPVLASSDSYEQSAEEPPITERAGGSRTGNCIGRQDIGRQDTTLTALAPLSHVGQTAAARPTLFLYVPAGATSANQELPRTIDFRVYQYDSDGRFDPQPVYQTELPAQAGMMPITLPDSAPELAIGRYYWRAALICDPQHGSEDLIVGAAIMRVASTTPLSQRWYDLFSGSIQDNPPAAIALLETLAAIEQTRSDAIETDAAPSQYAAEELRRRQRHILQQSQQLRRIADTWRSL